MRGEEERARAEQKTYPPPPPQKKGEPQQHEKEIYGRWAYMDARGKTILIVSNGKHIF